MGWDGMSIVFGEIRNLFARVGIADDVLIPLEVWYTRIYRLSKPSTMFCMRFGRK